MKSRIKELREDRGMSVRRLAKEAEIDPGYLSRLETGKREKPTHDVLLKLATALKTDVTELMGIELSVPKTVDGPLMDSVIGHLQGAIAEFKAKPASKLFSSWITMVYNSAVEQHLTFSQRRELAYTLVKVSKKDLKPQPLAKGEMPKKKARKTSSKR